MLAATTVRRFLYAGAFAALLAGAGCVSARNQFGGSSSGKTRDAVEPRRPESEGLEPNYGLALTAEPVRDLDALVALQPAATAQIWLRRVGSAGLVVTLDRSAAAASVSLRDGGDARELWRGTLRAETVAIYLTGAELRLVPDKGPAAKLTLERLNAGAASLRVTAGSAHAVAHSAAAGAFAPRTMAWVPPLANGFCTDTCVARGMLPVVAGVSHYDPEPMPLAVCRARAAYAGVDGVRAGSQGLPAQTRCVVVGADTDGIVPFDCLCEAGVGL